MTKKNDEFDLTKAHEANLKILKEIDRICRKYKIQYMLDAGTLLGAVRHQGFIPWDDDSDVAFTRKISRREEPSLILLHGFIIRTAGSMRIPWRHNIMRVR